MNVLAVLLAALLSVALGFAYYHPRVLGTRWLDALGKPRTSLGEPTAGIVTAGVTALLGAILLAVLLDWTRLVETGILGGLAAALLAWGFIACAVSLNAAFKGDRPALTLLDLGYHLVAYLAMGVVLGAWT